MDVMYPMAVVGTASRGLIIYTLEGGPAEYRVSFFLSLPLQSINNSVLYKDHGLGASSTVELLTCVRVHCDLIPFMNRGRI